MRRRKRKNGLRDLPRPDGGGRRRRHGLQAAVLARVSRGLRGELDQHLLLQGIAAYMPDLPQAFGARIRVR